MISAIDSTQSFTAAPVPDAKKLSVQSSYLHTMSINENQSYSPSFGASAKSVLHGASSVARGVLHATGSTASWMYRHPLTSCLGASSLSFAGFMGGLSPTFNGVPVLFPIALAGIFGAFIVIARRS